MATRHKEFASLCRKVMAMKGKVNEQKPAATRRVPEESSVGTVASPDMHDAEVALDSDGDAGDKDLAAVG
jgi:hypothetical protein